MPSNFSKTGRHFTEVARAAAIASKKAKRDDPEDFGAPELFIVKAAGRTFTWELRRFGGIVLQRSAEAFPDEGSARAAGERALAVLLATPGLPTFNRQLESRSDRGD